MSSPKTSLLSIGAIVAVGMVLLWWRRTANESDAELPRQGDEKEMKLVTIQTPSGEVEWKEYSSKMDRFNDIVSNLTSDELAALERDRNRAPAFIEKFVAADRRSGDLLEDLDVAFAAWLFSPDHHAYTPDDVIRIAGSALGYQAVERLGVRWARVEDSQGSVIALVTDVPPSRRFPFTSVQYRIEDNKTGFIVALFRAWEHTARNATK